MATVNWNVSKDARIADSGGTSLGAGASDFNPSGLYSGFKYRTLLGFSYSFSGMTAISSAILHMKSSSQYYVAFGSGPTVAVRRLSSSWSEGTSVSMSGSNAVEWSNQPGVTGSTSASTSMTGSELTWDTVDITTIIQEAFAANSFYGLRIYAPNETTSADVWEMCSREYSTSSDPYITVTYSTNTAPNSPTSLSPTGSTVVTGLSPTFTGTFSDPDAGDTMANAQVLVYEDNGTTLKWDSGSFAASGTSFSKVYTGAALTGNTYYQWKGRTADAAGAWGAYSALQRFKVNSTPNAPTISLTQSPTSDVKTLTPTFNITHSDPDASDSSMYAYRIHLYNSAWALVWDSGDVATTATVSKAVTYASTALSWQSSYQWRAATKDSNGAWGAYSGFAYFTTHTTGAPVSLSPTGGAVQGSLTPTFTASRATTADSLTSAQIRVYANDGVTLVWDTGTFTTGVTSTSLSKTYAGATLSYNTTYKWQARVTSSVGGTSAYSALQSFVTPDSATPTQTAPVGAPITTLTPTFTGSWSDTLKGIHIIVYTNAAGTAVHWDQGQVAATVGTTYSYVYAGTALAWNTQYWWKIEVQRNADSIWQGFGGLTSFTTDSAGIPILDSPTDAAWMGAPRVVEEFDDVTGVTNGTSASASLETGAGLFTTGIGSWKIAVTTLAASATSYTYKTLASPLDLTAFGYYTDASIQIRASSITNVQYIRMRFRFATGTDWADYMIKPTATGAFETKSWSKAVPDWSSGTIDWSNVMEIGIVIIAAGTGSVTGDFHVDNLIFDATNPSFDGTTYNSEVISTYRIRVYASDQTTLVWDSGDTAGSGTTFRKLYGGAALTKGLVYYWQARYVKSTGPTGDYSALRSFILNSDPSIPTGLSPASGDAIADSTVPTFSAIYNDPEKDTLGDYPTYMEVEVYRNSDSVLAYSLITATGLIAAENAIYDGLAGVTKVTGAAAPLVYETEYVYRVRYYDAKGARGSWSSYTNFKPSQSPTSTISTPSHLGTVSSPSFNVSWGITSPGGKGQNAYRVRLIRVSDAVTLVDTGVVYSSATTFVMPAGYLTNGSDFDITVDLWDTDGLTGTDTNRITANWTAPDPITNFIVTDDTSLSSTVLQWDASNLSGDFRKYVIYRKSSTDVDWNVLAELTNQTTTDYHDYTAANTVSYEYMMTQYQIIPGDVDLESAPSDIGNSTLDTDSWFVIGADRAAAHIFEVPVVAAPFSEPVQQEVFEPLGTSRKVIIRGRVMGAEGTLQGKWSTTQRDAALAQINYIKSNQGPHILKSPFGDVWIVEFSGPMKDYEKGGHITMSITWTEVA